MPEINTPPDYTRTATGRFCYSFLDLTGGKVSENRRETTPFQRAWNVFSAIAGVVGTAGIIDDIANWVGFIDSIVKGYSAIVHPLLNPVTKLFHLPSWFNDYLSVGVMLASSRSRPAFNLMRDHWRIAVSNYRWFELWAPHRVAVMIICLLMAFLWPLMLFTFLPPRLRNTNQAYTFQRRLWREQFQWMLVYGLTLLGLFITNAGLKALMSAATK